MKKTPVARAAHSILSPSSSHRWLVCPGSVKANRDKKHTSNFYSLEGTTAHALLEVCLRLECDPAHFVGMNLGTTPYGEQLHDIDEDMADGVGYALDYVKAYLADHPNAVVMPEHTVHYGETVGCDDGEAFGTGDIFIDNYPEELVAIDYKHGIGMPVSVKENTQIMIYCVGYRQLRGRYRRYRKVVVQPRLPKRKPVQEASVTDGQLMKWVNDVVRPVIPIALSEDAPRVAGGHCRYCAADGKCEAQFASVQAKASKEFKKARTNKDMTPEQVGELMDTLLWVDQIGKAVKAYAIELAHAGVDIPGWEADWTAPRRAWVNTDSAAVKLVQLGLPDPWAPVELLSPAKAEEALRKLKRWPAKPRGAAADFAINPFQGVVKYTDKNKSISRKVSASGSDT